MSTGQSLWRPTLAVTMICLLAQAGLVGVAPAHGQTVAELQARRGEIDRRFHNRLTQLAARCDELDLQAQAKLTRAWLIRRDPRRQYLFLPVGRDALKPKATAQQVVRYWHSKFSQHRRDYAQELFDLAHQSCVAGDVTSAYQMLHELLRQDVDHAEARRILGYKKTAGGLWRKAGREPTARRMNVRHSQLDWPARSYWRVDSDHFRISTNQSAAAGKEMAAELETLHHLWRQVFVRYWLSDAALLRRFQGSLPAPLSKKKHRVVLFEDRQQYLAHLRGENPRIEVSKGLYSQQDRIAYFYASDEPARTTWFHEATHQLFQETGVTVRDVAAADNAWIVEGVAQYMESLVKRDGYTTVGGADAQRLQFARHLAQGEDYYRPLAELVGVGRLALQADPDIGRLYWQSAGLAHFLMDHDGGRYRNAMGDYLQLVYQGRATEQSLALVTGVALERLDQQYRQSLAVTDDDMTFLSPQGGVRRLHLGHTDVTDRSLPLLAERKELEVLDLAYTGVTERGLAHLAGLTNLRILWLTGLPIGDSALETLESLKNLQEIDLRQSEVTPQGIQRLKKALPRLEFVE